MKKNISKIVLFLITMSFFLTPLMTLSADSPDSPSDDSLLGGLQATKLQGDTGARLKPNIGKIINIFLGFLGIIFVVMLMYGGFLWVTAGGEDEKVTKAKSMLKNAIIGVIIISAAFTIAQFVIQQSGQSFGLSDIPD